MANSEWTVTSMTDVARFFGVSHAVVRNDWRSRGMPGENGFYELDKIAQWKIERERERFARPEPDEEQKNLQERLEEAEVLKAEYDARLKEIKIAEAEGRLVDKLEVLAAWQAAFNIARVRIESIPQEVSTTFPPEIRADLTADLKHKFQLALRELASVAESEGWDEEA